MLIVVVGQSVTQRNSLRGGEHKMEIAQEFSTIVQTIINGAMLAPLGATLILGLFCFIWSIVNR